MGEYRYTLERSGWMGGSGRLCWVMLNPSTADDTADDPTIRRVIRFTRDHGYEALIVVNLFALRSTDPDQLPHHQDPIGPHNTDTIRAAIAYSSNVVCAWGSWLATTAAAGRLVRLPVTDYIRADLKQPLCLGTTKHGMPRHPLYVPAATRLQPYQLGAAA